MCIVQMAAHTEPKPIYNTDDRSLILIILMVFAEVFTHTFCCSSQLYTVKIWQFFKYQYVFDKMQYVLCLQCDGCRH
jgi:hypothetical protein